MDLGPKLTIAAPAASPEEAAAVVAAVEQFVRTRRRPPSPAAPRQDPWQRAALYEGIDRQPVAPMPWA
jgi:hypothetical protein